MAASLPSGVKLDAPAFGSVISRVAPIAGEMVPLPAGEWTTVAAVGGKGPGGTAVTYIALAQITNGQAATVIFLGALGMPGDDSGAGFPPVIGCQESRNIYNRVFISRDNGQQACWSVDAVAPSWDDQGDRMRSSATAELRQRGATLPAVVLRSRFVKSNKSHLLRIDLYQPAEVPPEGPSGWDWSHIMASPDRLARMTRLRDWAAAWWPLVDQGFSNQLRPAEITASLARLPS